MDIEEKKDESIENNVKKHGDGGKMDWKPVMLFYAKTTSWIIFPLIVGFLIGKYFGKSTGSQVLFFAAILVSFVITCLGIYREIKVYKKSLGLPKNTDKNKQNIEE